MSYKLVIAEKPSVAQSIAKVNQSYLSVLGTEQSRNMRSFIRNPATDKGQ